MGSTQKRIGDLRHRLNFQTLTLEGDGQGGSSESWDDAFTVWAEVKPISARERLYSQKLEQTTTHRVTVRYNNTTKEINSTMRFLFDDRKFEVKGALIVDERKAYITFEAEEGTPT